jgi:hypothetical protein
MMMLFRLCLGVRSTGSNKLATRTVFAKSIARFAPRPLNLQAFVISITPCFNLNYTPLPNTFPLNRQDTEQRPFKFTNNLYILDRGCFEEFASSYSQR